MKYQLNMLQLHGNETPRRVKDIKELTKLPRHESPFYH